MVMAGPGGGQPFVMRFRGDGPHDDPRMPVDDFMDMGPGERFEFLAGSPLGDLELAPLNPDLGQYFGTTDGVLVIRAPKDGTLGLKGGDVVQAVDGRKPAGPSHLMRILRSYDQGRDLQAGHPAEPEAGDRDRPPRRARPLMCAASQMSGPNGGISSAHPWRGLYEYPVDLDHRLGRRGDCQAADARTRSGRLHRDDADRRGRRPAGGISGTGAGLVQ